MTSAVKLFENKLNVDSSVGARGNVDNVVDVYQSEGRINVFNSKQLVGNLGCCRSVVTASTSCAGGNGYGVRDGLGTRVLQNYPRGFITKGNWNEKALYCYKKKRYRHRKIDS